MISAGYMESRSEVRRGKAVISGTRIAVELLLDKLVAGETEVQILAAHPRLTPKYFHAVLAFAAKRCASWDVSPDGQNWPVDLGWHAGGRGRSGPPREGSPTQRKPVRTPTVLSNRGGRAFARP